MSVLPELAERCEKAQGSDTDLDLDISEATGGWKALATWKGVSFTASLDAAMTLLPATAVNIDIFSFIGPHNPSWGCRFHDTAQLMGERAAKEQIARMQKGGAWGRELRGAPRVMLEKAIAEHFIEFMCMGAHTPALAICAAALRARAAIADTRPKDGDALAAPLASGGGAKQSPITPCNQTTP